MRILAIGDIVGESGLQYLRKELPPLIRQEKIDFVIANGENIASGMGILEKHFKQLLEIGVNVVTMGNHTWGKKDIFSFIDHPQLIRPANYPNGVQGKGMGIYECKGKKIAVMNLIGRTDMNILSENPFLKAKELVEQLQEEVEISVLDFHAEATAEKIAMGYYLDGKVSVVFGTHTHVQTADEVILEKGTGYVTDLGMTGPAKSVIGMDIEVSIKRFETTLPERYKLAEGNCKLNSYIFEINDETCRTERIIRINK